MHRIAARILVVAFCASASAGAQGSSTKPAPKFEVASLKRSAPGGRGGGIRPSPGGERYVATNCTLRLMLTVAYGIKDAQLSGAPDWVNTEFFDLNGKAEKPSNIDDLH